MIWTLTLNHTLGWKHFGVYASDKSVTNEHTIGLTFRFPLQLGGIGLIILIK